MVPAEIDLGQLASINGRTSGPPRLTDGENSPVAPHIDKSVLGSEEVDPAGEMDRSRPLALGRPDGNAKPPTDLRATTP